MKVRKGLIIKFVLILLFVFLFSIFPESFTGKIIPVNNQNYFPKVLSLLEKSTKSIYVIMFCAKYYEKYPTSPSNQLLNSLIKCAKKGVKVEIILDQSERKSSYSGEENLKTATYLSNNGITVHLDSIERTTHSKVLIIDEKYVIIGSTNWSYYSLTHNNESSVIIESPELARYYIKYFKRIKKECKIKISPRTR